MMVPEGTMAREILQSIEAHLARVDSRSRADAAMVIINALAGMSRTEARALHETVQALKGSPLKYQEGVESIIRTKITELVIR